MTLIYSLIKNKLNGNEDKYMGRLRSSGKYDLDRILDKMSQSGSTVTKSDAIAVIYLFFDVVTDILLNGGTINTDLFNIELRIKGNFTGPTDRYNKKRHKVEAAITSGKELKRALKLAKLKKDKPRSNNPYLLEFRYLDESVPTDQLVPGEVVRIRGNHLKLDLKDPDQKLILINGTEEIIIDKVFVNKAKELIFQLPQTIAPGTYQLEIHAKPGNCTEMRVGTLPRVLQKD